MDDMAQHQMTWIVKVIKDISAGHGLHIRRMILFGSRARGNARSNSDYDFIAVTDRPVSHQQKMELWLLISRALCKQHVMADVLFKSDTEFEADRTNPGKVTYYAIKEGVQV